MGVWPDEIPLASGWRSFRSVLSFDFTSARPGDLSPSPSGARTLNRQLRRGLSKVVGATQDGNRHCSLPAGDFLLSSHGHSTAPEFCKVTTVEQ